MVSVFSHKLGEGRELKNERYKLISTCCCSQRLREEILIMKKYFVTCREALESKLLLQVFM